MKRQHAHRFSVLFLISVSLVSCYSPREETKSVARQHLVPNPKANPFLDQVFDDYTNDLERMLDRTGLPGAAVVVVRDTSVIYTKCFGTKAIETTDSINLHSVFRLGSVSKCLAGLVTAALVQDGVLSWDDPVINYLPDFRLRSKEYSDQLTIRNVLSHTTGLPYHAYTTLIEDGLDLDTMISKLADVKNGPVGSEYSYQNVAFSIIAKVIEVATGKAYEQVLHDRIFKPLAMDDASVTMEGILATGNVAWPHLIRRTRWQRTTINNTYYNVAPAGGVNASISDMSRLLVALLGNRPNVISTDALGQIFEPVVPASVKNRNYRMIGRIQKSYYGMGWRIIQYPDDTLFFHGGYVNGYRSEIAIYPKDKLGICILSNGPGDVADKGIPMFMKAYLHRKDSIQHWEVQHTSVAKQSLQ